MGENKPLISKALKVNLYKLLPLFITIFVILMIGLSMIGNFYQVRLKENGEKIYFYYRLIDLISHNPASTGVAVFYILLYFVFPAIACLFLFLARFHKNFNVAAILLFLLLGVISIVSKDVFIYVLANNLGGDYTINELYFCSILPIITFFVSSLFTLSIASSEMEISVKDITEMGVLIASAFGLNFIKLFPAPTGGSVNLQMLPLFLLAIRRGPLKGFIGAGIAYGLITCLTDGYGFAFFPFDYLIGFGGVCVMGFFSKLIFPYGVTKYSFKGELFLFIAGVLATSIRFIAGTVSSMIFYAYDLVPAMTYNSMYVFVSGGIALAILMVLYKPIAIINKRFPSEAVPIEISE